MDIVGHFIYSNTTETEGETIKNIFCDIDTFIHTGEMNRIYCAMSRFMTIAGYSGPQLPYSIGLLEVSKHYEEGAKKYSERNWEKGIPCHCYVDSGIRHLIRWIGLWDDEPHDRAFLWNMLGLLWTVIHHPELNDLPYVTAKGDDIYA